MPESRGLWGHFRQERKPGPKNRLSEKAVSGCPMPVFKEPEEKDHLKTDQRMMPDNGCYAWLPLSSAGDKIEVAAGGDDGFVHYNSLMPSIDWEVVS